MELSYLINAILVIQVSGEVERKDITAIEIDSRKCKKNSLFVAIKGVSQDGHKYISNAINNGAVAVVLEDNSALPDEIFIHTKVTKILVPDCKSALAKLARALYQRPDEKLALIGITGTNGKTTTAFIIRHIYTTLQQKCGLIGTISIDTGAREREAALTTPQAHELAFYFDEMVHSGCTSAVMEVSSHALMLGRVVDLDFSVGVFTNITADHFDFHHTFENYFSAKKLLFAGLKNGRYALINADDPFGMKMAEEISGHTVFYGFSEKADFRISNAGTTLSGTTFTLRYKTEEYLVRSALIGEFNVYNLTAAIGATVLNGVSFKSAVDGASSMPGVAGRFEIYEQNDIRVVVDYSHTADSLEQAIKNLRAISQPDTKIVTVFGCGGDRDTTKRPLMGKVAEALSDFVYVTSDNPRSENPDLIIADILQGMSKNNHVAIADRREAIFTAVREAQPNTAILLAGKGHETYQIIGKEKQHFSDLETAQEAFTQ